MESENALQCSQEPATSPYSEPDESSPHHENQFPPDALSLLSLIFFGLPEHSLRVILNRVLRGIYET
jgi:hypothetical protein